jgi:polyisoprenyl-phosphate glycosyltransferase
MARSSRLRFFRTTNQREKLDKMLLSARLRDMPSQSDQSLSVVLPAHNECASLPAIIPAILDEIERLGLRPEVIVVDDGSTDRTRELMLSLAANDARLRYIRFSRNFGKEAALSAGLAVATGDAVIIMDADGQHPPEMIPEFVKHWHDGKEIVYAQRLKRADPGWMIIAKHVFYRIMKAGSTVAIPEDGGDFRLLDRKVIDILNALPERNRFMKGLYGWVGFQLQAVPFDVAPRMSGRTHYTFHRLISLGLTALTSFSVAPLRLVSVAGLLVSAMSVIYGCYILFEHFVLGAGAPRGWATLAVGTMFLSGLQLLCLGVIGEYLGRVFEEVKGRPLYVVAEDTAKMRDGRAPGSSSDAKVIKL